MDDVEFARALHVLSIVFWIGGVAFVTTVLLPEVRRAKAPADRLEFFEQIERRFAWQARGTVLLTGLSGVYMLIRLNLWPAFEMPGYWWMHAMVGVWLIFALMLFVAEPLFLHRWLRMRAKARPEETYQLVERLHRLLLALSAITVLGAVAGAHGWMFQ
jgi:uncharacterized membrane protein